MNHVAPPPLRTRAARHLGTLAGAAIVGATLATAPIAHAGAQTAPDPVAALDAKVTALSAEADALADRYFEALGHVAEIQQRADEIEAKLPALRAEAAHLRDVTRKRAVEAYKRSGRDLGTLVNARDPLDAARRVRWLQRLNQRDNHAVENLQDAMARLDAQRAELRSAREDADRALAEAKAQGDQINTLLGDAEQQRQAAVLAALAPPAAAGTGTGTESNLSGGSSGSPAPSATIPTTTTPTAPPKTPPPAPPSYVPTAGVHARHDEPFLVCTRARESGGNYAAFNAAGPYLGAYQFLQATWNSTANHAGRTELMNVPPSTASQYDQDDMAWALYQWQGSRPWGGLCDAA